MSRDPDFFKIFPRRLILLLFTADFVTAPLAATAAMPRQTCKPTGLLGALARLEVFEGHPAGDFARALTSAADVGTLRGLEVATRLLLGLAALGLGTTVTAPLACVAWVFYGGVLHAYNTWRGHSFIAAWWGLAILSVRGGAADAWSLDSLLRRRRRAQHRGGGDVCDDDAADARGWTRFLITFVLANNYLMAGGTKLAASGVLWANGPNLKAKLLASTLNGRHLIPAGNLSLLLRQLPTPFWTSLGAAGLFGELAMGLVPFWAFAKLCFPAAMWLMHVGIFFLQHILFVDLLASRAASSLFTFSQEGTSSRERPSPSPRLASTSETPDSPARSS